MPTNTELLMRLRTLSTSVSTLRLAASECARELQAFLELASCVDESLPASHRSLETVYVDRFRLDPATFSVSDGSRVCELGNTVCFRLFECLASEPNRSFTRVQLLSSVWDGQRRAATTVRNAVFVLRHRLSEAGMAELANAIRTDGRAYSLKLGR